MPWIFSNKTGWWFQPLWKIWTSKWESSPNFRGENKKYLSCHHLEKKSSHSQRFQRHIFQPPPQRQATQYALQARETSSRIPGKPLRSRHEGLPWRISSNIAEPLQDLERPNPRTPSDVKSRNVCWMVAGGYTRPKTNIATRELMVGRLLSYWRGRIFRGFATFITGTVLCGDSGLEQHTWKNHWLLFWRNTILLRSWVNCSFAFPTGKKIPCTNPAIRCSTTAFFWFHLCP